MISAQRVDENGFYIRLFDGREFTISKADIVTKRARLNRRATEAEIKDDLGRFLGEGYDKENFVFEIAEDGTPVNLTCFNPGALDPQRNGS